MACNPTLYLGSPSLGQPLIARKDFYYVLYYLFEDLSRAYAIQRPVQRDKNQSNVRPQTVT